VLSVVNGTVLIGGYFDQVACNSMCVHELQGYRIFVGLVEK